MARMRASIPEAAAGFLRATGVMILCGWCAGCANDRLGQGLASWQGSTFAAVTTAWGHPQQCEHDEATRVCTWRLRPTAGGVGALPGLGPRCLTMFEFDANERVIGWRWRGDRCRQFVPPVAAKSAGKRPAVLAHAPWREPEPGVVTTTGAPAQD